MKCPCCGHKVWCQACGRDVRSSQSRWARCQALKGKCPRCGATKTKQDGPHVNCFKCRKQNAERNRQRYATHGRKDRRGKTLAA